MKRIYYIEAALNGYIVKEIPICDWDPERDYTDRLVFEDNGRTVDYYDVIAGDTDDLDTFLKHASHLACADYEDTVGTKPNVYLEFWLTDNIGYYEDRYLGLIIK